MLLGDKIIDDQGNARTLGGSQDARLYYEDINGNRKKYLLDGEGGITGSYVSTINGMSGEVTLTTSNLQNDSGYITSDNIPVSSVNGQTGDILLDVHDIKYETIGALALSSYVYYTVSGVLTGDIQFTIPPGLHDTMVKFSTGPSASFTFSVSEDMQLNKEFDFEPEKNYIIAVDNGTIFWNELQVTLSDESEGGRWIFKASDSGIDILDGQRFEYDPDAVFTPPYEYIYRSEDGLTLRSVTNEDPDWEGEGTRYYTYIEVFDSSNEYLLTAEMFGFIMNGPLDGDQYYWNLQNQNYSSVFTNTVTLTPIV